ncbi:MAG: methyltransferase domain-containing protein [Candidatus Doudnabacteria bacterium]
MDNFVFEPSNKFLDPERILFAAGLTPGQTVADLGTGSGFYTQAAGKIVGDAGLVYACDILETALDHVAAEGRLKGLRNLKSFRTDLELPNSCAVIPVGSVDLVIMANIAHQIKNPTAMFKEAYRILKTGGKLVVTEWNDQPSPIGPQVEDRVSSEQVVKLAKQATLKEAGTLLTDNYHFGLMFIK